MSPTRDPFAINGRCALVTGAASGMGAAVARVLGEAGADLALHTARSFDVAAGYGSGADDLAGQIRGLGQRALVIDADLSLPGAAAGVAAQARAGLGGIDILVICASVQERAPFLSVDAHGIESQINTNFRATIELIQSVLPDMLKRGWGRVLAIGSINQLRPESELAIYAALKAAQHNLIMNLARTYASAGVTFNTLSPGLIETERNRWRRADAAEWRRIEQAANPMQRAGAPSEIVGAALLLCSPAGSFVTGIDLQVSGGAQL
jgi:NAD(P)-dependent dehydrogenase (short-subunit alcohol dehydrogenase family)